MTAVIDLPPGFRFHPTDEELVVHYLCRKCASQSISIPIIAEIDLYKCDPWLLPSMALYGEKEWYFFSPRDRKYPNGSRPNRAAGCGYWKATGADKPIGKPKPIGIKKALVFYAGKAPKGEKTNWIMHEYRLADVDRSARKKNNLRLDDWVLCRIYNKKGVPEKQPNKEKGTATTVTSFSETKECKPETGINANHTMPTIMSDFGYFDASASDSIPKLHTDSSCSEHVISPEFTCEREVQSQPRSRSDWGNALDNPLQNIDMISNNSYPQFENVQLSPAYRDPYLDMLMYLQKPF
eukprot:TRINITY_DN16821_c0_g1_i1.p1 TRINITY_DN16821_c0_g1~~TRINITY_DN16821_c0_g1_i1.p1  ORF type:complete len:295 (+),score=21.30 TRINITY_DN16821_c0_g1_i1:56-940(+)